MCPWSTTLFPYTTLFRSGLRAHEDVHAERPALAHEAVEQERRFLGELVVFDEELLEFIDDEYDPRHRFLARSEEHTSELQSLRHLVCRLLLEKKNTILNI